jgi:hypothetical protein
MDVKTPFLNSVIEEEVDVYKLRGFEVQGSETHAYRLKKVLMG